jgi:hypothetical protein
MNAFQAWRDWAAGLDDAAFSRLWLGLGANAALQQDGLAADAFAQVWDAALVHRELRWVMPGLSGLAAIREQGMGAAEWLARWEGDIGNRLDKVPVRIDRWRGDASTEAGYGALIRVAGVATIVMPGVRHSMLDWPLRLAALSERDGAELDRCLGLWPANELARRVGTQMDGYRCDLILHSGEPEALAAQLRLRSIAAAILVVRLPRPCSVEDPRKLEALCEAVQAGGYVLVEDDPGIDVEGRLCRFVEEMSHARRADVAASLAFRGTPHMRLIGLGDALARFSIRDVAERLQARTFELERARSLTLDARRALDAAMPRVPSMSAPAPADSSGLESLGGESAALPGGGLESLGGDAAAAPAEAPPSAAPEAVIPDYERLEAPYDHEWGGARGLVEAAAVLDRAEAVISNQRFLQQQAFLLRDGEEVPANRGFVVGRPARIHVHIGPPDGASNALPEAFPENALPQEQESWELQVWLSEPTHVVEPLPGIIHLHRHGASSACAFEFTPESAEPFNGRISVLHRGRVLQTAALRASVHAEDAIPESASAPRLESLLQVRQELSSLDRRRFDLAVVLTHSGAGQPTAHAMSGKRAWMSNLGVVGKTVEDINQLLSSAARTARDFDGGLDSSKGRNLLRKLAQLGNYLHLYLVESHVASGGANAAVLQGEFIQVISTRSDAVVVPFEFIYEFDAPGDAAEVCPNWREAVANGRCAATCSPGEDVFCPMGFWGLGKVIERHALQAELAAEGEVGVHNDPAGPRDTLSLSGAAVFGCSQRVVDAQLDPLRQQLLAAQIAGSQATDWADWKTRVGENSPSLLIALAHSDGSGQDATV